MFVQCATDIEETYEIEHLSLQIINECISSNAFDNWGWGWGEWSTILKQSHTRMLFVFLKSDRKIILDSDDRADWTPVKRPEYNPPLS